ncbi:RhoGAP_domain-containing protein [Hexamita inflata]|uniref:RhoGAP domain-containing protein n=1 Tax=Hexamita inflata TaxID=28002 RepID=A0AA86UWR0_9EUKA|nr:RhoGAP domain-containing protein [Hexamita inflata]
MNVSYDESYYSYDEVSAPSSPQNFISMSQNCRLSVQSRSELKLIPVNYQFFAQNCIRTIVPKRKINSNRPKSAQIIIVLTFILQMVAFFVSLMGEFNYKRFWGTLIALGFGVCASVNQFSVPRFNLFVQKHFGMLNSLQGVIVVQVLLLQVFSYEFDVKKITLFVATVIMLASIVGIIALIITLLVQTQMNKQIQSTDYAKQQEELEQVEKIVQEDQMAKEEIKIVLQERKQHIETIEMDEKTKTDITNDDNTEDIQLTDLQNSKIEKQEAPKIHQIQKQTNGKQEIDRDAILKLAQSSQMSNEPLQPMSITLGNFNSSGVNQCKNSNIPKFILKATTIILANADTEGIFRVSPQETELKDLKAELQRKNDVTDIKSIKIHTLCSLLKYFYRQMKPVLISNETMQQFRGADNKIDQLTWAIVEISEPNRSNLLYLLKFLNTIAQNPNNKMTVQNLSIVFIPNITDIFMQGDQGILENLITNIDELIDNSKHHTF